MQFKPILVVLLLYFVFPYSSLAQSVPAVKDSNKLYENIESYSRRNKFTKFVYRLIFRTPPTTLPQKGEVIKGENKTVVKSLKKKGKNFEGKIIRHISIESLDPFGHFVGDTIIAPQNFFLRAGNKVHVKTQRKIIQNLLLFHKNQPYDSLLVRESERLIRNQNYVRDVFIYALLTSKYSDSVDIYIRELDKWSIVAAIGASPSKVVVKVVEKNFLGIGHESENNYTWFHHTGEDAFYSNYYIPNIHDTYINTTLHYGTDENRNSVRSLVLDRPFYSPFAKWAGGANLSQTMHRDSFLIEEKVSILQKFKLNTQDYWLGNSMQIFKGNSENNRSTNFISAIRYIRSTYSQKPDAKYDTLHTFTPANSYLGTFGISTRKYVQDNYIVKFGVTEDIPVGKVYSISGAYLDQNKVGHLYLGARISMGNFFPLGYLSTNCEYGTFFRAGKTSQGLLNFSIIYFTKLFEIGKWKFREFAKPQLSLGINRGKLEGLNINDGNGIDGFNSSNLIGTNRILLKLQTQSYAPWKIIGFHFGPYLVYSAAMLSNTNSGFARSKLYSQFGIGFLIKNENLVFGSLQFSISFYPLIPGYKQNAFKINSFKTGDFNFRDFEIGQPSVLGYQ